MARRRSLFSRRARRLDPGSLLVLLVLGLLLAYPRLLVLIATVTLVAAGLHWSAKWIRKQEQRRALRQLELHQVDAMHPLAFEEFVAELLAVRGYRTQLTKASHDFGADVVASQGSRRIAVQVKHYSSAVSGAAVAEALLGMPHYRCNECMVVTNSSFTRAAIKAAAPHPCRLVDRHTLARWIQEARKESQ